MLNKVLISLAWFILMLIQIFWPLNHAYQSISVIKLPAVTQNHFIYDSITRPKKIQDTIVPAISTFLGNEQKNYYGNSASSKLDVIWRKYLGSGKTYIPNSRRASIWFGAGWTGQPLLIKERKRKYLIQGAYDHKLKKIDALTGEIIWEYSFDDVIKGTGTFWINSKAENAEDGPFHI
ncbi:MAG: hypothetical protein HY738_20390 [Bacteroidia bacterium]|nr:hypothetical protein [Bacteroidia bacterium]